MKILIIAMFPEEEVPYANLYTDFLDKRDIDYDVVFWNREVTAPTTYQDNKILFNLECRMGGSKFKKIGKMLKYARFIRDCAKKIEYTHAIILTTVPGIFLNDILATKYHGKYILDIRDYTNESNSIYYNIEKRVIRNSFETVISSEGFKKFLPLKDYIICHNISNDELAFSEVKNLANSRKLKIGFVGNVRYADENYSLISQLDENEFEFLYWGKMIAGCNLPELCEEHGKVNVRFKGKFLNSDKPSIYKEIDMINAVYGSSGLEVTTAIPNRFYDAVLFKKPIIASKGTYLGELVEESGIGVAIDLDDNHVSNRILQYVKSFDSDAFVTNTEKLWKSFQKDKNDFERVLLSFVQEGENKCTNEVG